MGNPPRHVRPGGLSLGREKIGDVIEGQHVTKHALTLHFRDHRGLQRPHFAVRAGVEHVVGVQRRRLHLGSGQQITEDREQLGQAGAHVLFQLEVDQLVGARVGQVDAKLAVEADHPPRDTGEHSLGEATAQVGFVGGPQQLELLRLDLVGHAVEGVGQGCQLIPCSVVRDRYPGGQVARTQPVRRPRQLQQRRRQPQREPQPSHPGNDH